MKYLSEHRMLNARDIIERGEGLLKAHHSWRSISKRGQYFKSETEFVQNLGVVYFLV